MNIYDIARLAGVSIATVSRVVNDSPKVSEKTKAAVRKVMEEQNYTPNAFARGLGLGTMRTVGIVCPDVADAYMAKAVSYLEKNLQGYGYDCLLSCSGYEDTGRAEAVALLLKRQIDALVLVGSVYSDRNSAVFPQIREAAEQIPVFLINGHLENQNVYCVLADDHNAAYDAVMQLLHAGKKELLFLGSSHSYSANQKRQGYEDALRDSGITVQPERILYTENRISTVRDLLFDCGLSFDGILAAEDGIAVGALKYAKAVGRAVPEDLSVIGYNNSALAVSCEPELTSIDNQVELLCRTAIDSMMTVLDGEAVVSPQVIPCRLVERQST